MKKRLLISILFVLMFVVFGCATQEVSDIVPEENPQVEEVVQPSSEPSIEEADVVPAISIIQIPSTAKENEKVEIQWKIESEQPLTAIHTAIHYDTKSHPGTFTNEVGPIDSGYFSLTREYASGEFPVPDGFLTSFTIPKEAQNLYLRAHAIIDGKNYWTGETSIGVEPALPAPPVSFEDKFDGTSIEQDRYSTTITGAGTIAQNNEIVMAGKGKKTIIWNVLYTKGDVDLTKGFTASVKINIKKRAVTVGDDMAIIGIEQREKVQAGGRPDKAGYCEVFVERGNEKHLRMENTLGQSTKGEGVRVSTTSGILTLTYLPENNLLKCSFDNKEVTLPQPQDTGSFVLTLRTGMHKDIVGGGEYSEAGGTGEFETVFDDLKFKVE